MANRLFSRGKRSGSVGWDADRDRLARAGDRLSGLLWHSHIDRVARGLATVVNVLDPDVLVMGGGMSNVDELYRDLPGALTKRTFSTVFHTPIRRNLHGDASSVRGAAWLWK